MGVPDSAWLASGEEEALEVDMHLCDPHHHHWDRPGWRYGRQELARDVRGHRVASTVFVECGAGYRPDGPASLRPVGETEFVESLARETRGKEDEAELDAAIVGHADLLLGEEVRAVLEAHLVASPDRFRGIRHSAAWHESSEIRRSHADPPPHMLTLPEFRAGFAQLRRYDLSFDAWLFHTQIDELRDLAQAYPDTVIVLDHMGGPLGIGPFAGKRAEVMEDWKRSIRSLAVCENVVVKLGGLQMEICGFGWHARPRPPSSQELAATVRDYYLHCIDCFGAERCMFESNFPVDKVSCSYNVLWNAFKRMTQDFSARERKALFADTAERVYRIGSALRLPVTD